jgi:hypothetical protein
VLDGSAQGWAMEVQFAGVRPAPLAPASSPPAVAAAAAELAASEGRPQSEVDEAGRRLVTAAEVGGVGG